MRKKRLILLAILLITGLALLIAQNHKSIINKTLSVFIQNENTLEMPDYPITTPLPVFKDNSSKASANVEATSPYNEFMND